MGKDTCFSWWLIPTSLSLSSTQRPPGEESGGEGDFVSHETWNSRTESSLDLVSRSGSRGVEMSGERGEKGKGRTFVTWERDRNM